MIEIGGNNCQSIGLLHCRPSTEIAELKEEVANGSTDQPIARPIKNIPELVVLGLVGDVILGERSF